jgi:hypothetical protein
MKLVNGFADYCVAGTISFAAKQWLKTSRRMTLIRLDVLPLAIAEARRVAFTPIRRKISATSRLQLQWRLAHLSRVPLGVEAV